MEELAGVDPVRVFLVDDHAVVRTGLAAYLATEPGIPVVGQAANGRRRLAQIAALVTATQLPDVVLMDLLMPAMDGIEATRQVKAAVARGRGRGGDQLRGGGADPGALRGGRGRLPAQGRRRRRTSWPRSVRPSPARCTSTPPPPGR